MGAFGIMKKIKTNSVPDNVIPEPTEELKSLTLEPFVLAFLVLLFGFVISTAVFILEASNVCLRLNKK